MEHPGPKPNAIASTAVERLVCLSHHVTEPPRNAFLLKLHSWKENASTLLFWLAKELCPATMQKLQVMQKCRYHIGLFCFVLPVNTLSRVRYLRVKTDQESDKLIYSIFPKSNLSVFLNCGTVLLSWLWVGYSLIMSFNPTFWGTVHMFYWSSSVWRKERACYSHLKNFPNNLTLTPPVYSHQKHQCVKYYVSTDWADVCILIGKDQ